MRSPPTLPPPQNLKCAPYSYFLNKGCPKKFATIRGTVHCCFVVKSCFPRVSDKTGNKWSKDIFIQIYN